MTLSLPPIQKAQPYCQFGWKNCTGDYHGSDKLCPVFKGEDVLAERLARDEKEKQLIKQLEEILEMESKRRAKILQGARNHRELYLDLNELAENVEHSLRVLVVGLKKQ